MSERISVFEQLSEYLEAKASYDSEKEMNDNNTYKKSLQEVDEANDLSEYDTIMKRTNKALMECPIKLLEDYESEAEYTNDMMSYDLNKMKTELRILGERIPATIEEQEEMEAEERKLKADMASLEKQYNQGIEQLELLKDILAARGHVESTEENKENEDNDPGSETLDQGPKTFRP